MALIIFYLKKERKNITSRINIFKHVYNSLRLIAAGARIQIKSAFVNKIILSSLYQGLFFNNNDNKTFLTFLLCWAQ